jgi:hypothetical protein
MLVLLMGFASAGMPAVIMVLVFVKKKWLPFQERDPVLLIFGCLGHICFALTSPAVTNPGNFPNSGKARVPSPSPSSSFLFSFSVLLSDLARRFQQVQRFCEFVVDGCDPAADEDCIVASDSCEEPEEGMLALMLPYGLGLGLWLACIVVRFRVLVKVHLVNKVPVSSICQGDPLPNCLTAALAWCRLAEVRAACAVLLFVAPGVAASFFVGPGGSVIGRIAWVIVLLVLTGHLAMLTLALWPLKTGITDIPPHAICGIAVGLAGLVLAILTLLGSSYDNPSGGTNIIFPIAIMGVMDVHLIFAVRHRPPPPPSRPCSPLGPRESTGGEACLEAGEARRGIFEAVRPSPDQIIYFRKYRTGGARYSLTSATPPRKIRRWQRRTDRGLALEDGVARRQGPLSGPPSPWPSSLFPLF